VTAGTEDQKAARVDTSPHVSDEIKTTTCYMCACRCGIKVHLTDGKLRYIEGNPDHPVNKGVLCAKGSAGIMQQASPAKLQKPLKRVGPRGEGPYKEIEWDEALALAGDWLAAIRRKDPRGLAFFTGRDQSQSLTSWWAQKFGTPNYAAHGGFCSVNMAAAGLYTIGGSFWEFGEPDWERTRYFLMFGVAEDHDSNPIKAGLAKLKERGAKFVSVNPVRTGYSAIAHQWLPIRPGTDGLLASALIHEMLRAGKVDLSYLVRYTNAPWLVIENPGGADDGLFARDDSGNPLAWDRGSDQPVNALTANITPQLTGALTLPDGRNVRPAFDLMSARFLDPANAPAAVAERTGIAAETIETIARELAHEEEITLDIPWTDWAGRRHETITGRPVSMHAMRGISAHSNGFHTCRLLHVLQMLLGTIDVPGGFLYKPPYPKPCPPPVKPFGRTNHVKPDSPLTGPHLGFVEGPEDLLVEDDGSPCRIDKGFSWEAPFASHGLMHMVIRNAYEGDPYPIDTLFMYMANMSWNSSMNTGATIDMLTAKDEETGEYRIPHIIYSDAFASEMVSYADLILPDTTYLERYDCISLLDRPISSAEGPADAIRRPVIEPDRDVRPFQDVLLDLGVRLGLEGMTGDDGTPVYPGGYADYIANHQRRPGIGPLAGWRGAAGTDAFVAPANPDQLERYAENDCYWSHTLAPAQRYYRFANREYLDWAVEAGFAGNAEPIILQLYSEPLQKFRLAAQGHGTIQPPDHLRDRVATYFDPLPFWYPPLSEGKDPDDTWPLHAITQRPMAMYHSWGSQNAWLRQIHGDNCLYMNRETAGSYGIDDGDWIWVESETGRIKGEVRLMEGVNRDTIWTWNAIAKRRGAWNLAPNAAEASRAVLLNHLIPERLPHTGDENAAAEAAHGMRSNSDPVTGQAAWYDLKVRISKTRAPAEDGESAPQLGVLPALPGLDEAPGILRYGEAFRGRTKPLRRFGK
jgi:anaerobic selenocysteine-containing dehydrogenase